MTTTPRIAVVTGAAGGIGRAIAKRLARDGWALALADRDMAGLTALAEELGRSGADVSLHATDLLDREAPERLLADVLTARGAVHLLVNNAGITVLGALESQTREDVERVLAVNLVAVAQLCRVFAPVLIASAPSHIVNIASFAGALAFPLQTTYSASKFGVRGLSQALRIELSDRRVGVSAVMPGSVATELMKDATSYDSATSAQFTEMMLRHGASPDAVAEAVVTCVHSNRAEILIGWDAHLGTHAHRWAPWLVRAAFVSGWARYRRTLDGPARK